MGHCENGESLYQGQTVRQFIYGNHWYNFVFYSSNISDSYPVVGKKKMVHMWELYTVIEYINSPLLYLMW